RLERQHRAAQHGHVAQLARTRYLAFLARLAQPFFTRAFGAVLLLRLFAHRRISRSARARPRTHPRTAAGPAIRARASAASAGSGRPAATSAGRSASG